MSYRNQKLGMVVRVIFLVLIISIATFIVYSLGAEIKRFWEVFVSLDEKLRATIIVLLGAVIVAITAIITATLTHHWTKKREIEGTQRVHKSEIYKDFVDTLVKSIRGVESEGNEGKSETELAEDLKELIYNFIGGLIVWGSPRMIRAYRQFQKSAESDTKTLLLSVDNLFREIRKDLGQSNKGLKQHDLYTLFLTEDITEELEKLEQPPNSSAP